MKYDFIEIGTSDFDTLIEKSNNSIKGISIEPLQIYLNNLPEKDGVIKSNYAVSNFNGNIDLYYINPKKISELNLPFGFRGCNSIGKPHPALSRILKNKYDELVDIIQVEVITWNDIVSKYNVDSVNLIKIDTEGHDHIILEEYYKLCIEKPNLQADKIIFEYNELSNKPILLNLINKFEALGYKHDFKDNNNCMIYKQRYI